MVVRKQGKGKHHKTGPKTAYIEEGVTPPAYEVAWAALDDLINAGIPSMPVRGLPDRLVPECVREARLLLTKYRGLTVLRACELAISTVYLRHKYTPTFNSYCYPERQVAERIL